MNYEILYDIIEKNGVLLGGINIDISILDKVRENIKKVIVGKDRSIDLILTALISGGHVLIEDIPGVGKTTLVKSLARSLDVSFKRIQFTPDLLPSDITGSSVYNQKTSEFEFKKGPIFSELILADEINRTSPKTQSSLLEVMEENQVTVDGMTFKMPDLFMVMATQNPIEYEGTYPLPESQLDRFMMKITMGYPEDFEEINIIKRFILNKSSDIKKVADAADIIELKKKVGDIYIRDSVMQYIVDIVNLTRKSEYSYLGASPRASIMLSRGAQALAMLKDRDYVIPDDVKELAVPVLAHRVIVKPEYRMNNLTNEKFIKNIIDDIYIPVVKA